MKLVCSFFSKKYSYFMQKMSTFSSYDHHTNGIMPAVMWSLSKIFIIENETQIQNFSLYGPIIETIYEAFGSCYFTFSYHYLHLSRAGWRNNGYGFYYFAIIDVCSKWAPFLFTKLTLYVDPLVYIFCCTGIKIPKMRSHIINI